jgi:30S ribosomal protein S31
MGKGDIKSKKGKIANKSYGVRRLTKSAIRKAARSEKGIVLEPAKKAKHNQG